MLQNINYTLLISLLVILGFSDCYYDNEDELFPNAGIDCDTTSISYTDDILEILNFRCFSCHEDGIAGDGIIFKEYNELKVLVENGKLLGSIKHNPCCSPMPKDDNQLPDCEINKVEAWIRDGALNN